MTVNEKKILKAVLEHPKGLLSPADLINGIAQKDRRSVESLVSKKYLEEVPQQHHSSGRGNFTINFYRITEKGLLVSAPWYTKMWMWIRGDVRTVITSAVISLITTLITIFLGKFFQ